jgi:DNA-binding response OmpR family regulator
MTLMKVLLVEDEQSMLFTLSNLLKHRGYEVIAAHSAFSNIVGTKLSPRILRRKAWKSWGITRLIW